MRKLSDLEVEELKDCLDKLDACLRCLTSCDSYTEFCNTSELINFKYEQLKSLIMKRFED